MKRPAWIFAALVASLALALPAGAAAGRTVRGIVVSVSPTAVAVQDAKGVVTTCAVASRSPSLASYAAGQRVQLQCARRKGQLVLERVRHLAASATTSTDEAKPVTFAGAITALTDGSISLHDGDRDLTCTVDATSPSTTGYAVGQHARVACLSGTLVKIEAITAATTPSKPTGDAPHTTTGAVGTLTALSATALTVHTDGGDVSCAVGDGSPRLGDFHVGDEVKLACLDGKVVALVKVETTPAPAPAPTTLTAGGAITALSTSTLTVHNDEHGDITCTLGPSSPGLGDYHLGDHVGIACAGGVLVKIVRLS